MGFFVMIKELLKNKIYEIQEGWLVFIARILTASLVMGLIVNLMK